MLIGMASPRENHVVISGILFISFLAVLHTEDVARFRVEAERVTWFDSRPVYSTAVSVGEKVLSVCAAGF